MYVYICVYIHIFGYIYICIRIFVHEYIHICIYIDFFLIQVLESEMKDYVK